MRNTLKIQLSPSTRMACTIGLCVAFALSLPVISNAQEFERGGPTVTCSSTDGRLTYCDTDTRAGVSLLRQLSSARCEQGSTWGYTDRGVWVDRGCQAEFALGYRARGGDWDSNRGRYARLDPGTVIPVRTDQYINSERSDGRVYTGTIDRDVIDDVGRLAIPRGSAAELIVRVAPDHDLILDLESVVVNGERYAVRADADRLESRDNVGANRRTGEFVGGGALLGSIVGAIAGGGKGAAIGAAAGAAAGAGAEFATHGKVVRVPPETLLTFRLERPMSLGVPDRGSDRNGFHYHPH